MQTIYLVVLMLLPQTLKSLLHNKNLQYFNRQRELESWNSTIRITSQLRQLPLVTEQLQSLKLICLIKALVCCPVIQPTHPQPTSVLVPCRKSIIISSNTELEYKIDTQHFFHNPFFIANDSVFFWTIIIMETNGKFVLENTILSCFCLLSKISFQSTIAQNEFLLLMYLNMC